MDSNRIIQLSDCHLSASADAVYRGINPRSELEKLLAAVSDWQPDLLLLTGDLAEDGSREAYDYLQSRLAALDVPVHTLPGNHDDHQIQSRVFTSTSVDEALQISAGAWKLVLLNSSRPKMIAGKLDPAQLDSMEAAVAAFAGPVMVFLHHQPVPVGSSWIDRYSLQSPERFWGVVERHENIKVVAWGHVHQVFEAGREHARLLSAPSSAINSVPCKEKFTPDQAGPACRWFLAHAGGELESGILRA